MPPRDNWSKAWLVRNDVSGFRHVYCGVVHCLFAHHLVAIAAELTESENAQRTLEQRKWCLTTQVCTLLPLLTCLVIFCLQDTSKLVLNSPLNDGECEIFKQVRSNELLLPCRCLFLVLITDLSQKLLA